MSHRVTKADAQLLLRAQVQGIADAISAAVSGITSRRGHAYEEKVRETITSIINIGHAAGVASRDMTQEEQAPFMDIFSAIVAENLMNGRQLFTDSDLTMAIRLYRSRSSTKN